MRRRLRRVAVGAGGLLLLLAVAVAGLAAGCTSIGYVAQAAGGHIDVMRRARPVDAWLADPATSAALRERLLLSQRIRAFAVEHLALPDNASYRRYANLERGAVVWNVVAAPELGLTLKTWCFPVMGCVGYRGYFDRAEAEALAAGLRAEGWEASVYGVPAYSTLGWTNWLGGDPLLNTFMQWPEGELARLIFHELAHQVAYASDDTMFNESFATTVERVGGARWLQASAHVAAREEYRVFDERRQAFRALTARTRQALHALYVGDLPDDAKRLRKAEIYAAMRDDYRAMKTGPWGGYAGYDGWFERANNAALAVMGAYDELVPDFERLLERQGGNLPSFYAEVQRLADLPKPERRARLAPPP